MDPKDPNDKDVLYYDVIKTDGKTHQEITENILDILSRIEWKEIKGPVETMNYTIKENGTIDISLQKPALTWDSIFPDGGKTLTGFNILPWKSNVVDFAAAKRRLRPKFLTSL